MTELTSILSGGVEEARRILSIHANHLKEIRNAFLILGFGALGVGLFYTWLRCAERRQAKLREQALQEKPGQTLPKQEAEEGRTECICCYDAPATVVFNPCGHLITCEKCAEVLKTRGQPCPYCRREVDYSRNFMFLKSDKKVAAK